MGLAKKLARSSVHVLSGGHSLLTKQGRKSFRRDWRDARKKLGITSKSKYVRQARRHLGLGNKSVVTSQPTSASSVGYQYQPRTLSQLTGGV